MPVPINDMPADRLVLGFPELPIEGNAQQLEGAAESD
jgi:hypothetical protein